MRNNVRKSGIAIVLMLILANVHSVLAQQYASPTAPAKTGRSPGVKVKLLSKNGPVKTYVLVFAKNDEIISGLTEFAQI
ncbi:hypothetical protein [uncultured Mucilaginibacter sp.]|uniref:hypothetical protein n=1 Tax=uncultured Mucilaginibacter sp. TaxID=797541 RepID=UPI0025F15892|nr:hypothetical protein [uncultured Mucilaginibacter sp.]